MPPKAQQGYLVLADISGFTSFLAQTELEHAHEILTDLMEIITKEFRSLLEVSKLEGDAVFAYAPLSRVSRGESVVELLEATYVAFRRRVDGVKRRTMCECSACRSIPILDLKFVTHVGEYIPQNVAGGQELLGSDVNLVHRLLKNKVAETTGWRAYLLFTKQALDKIELNPDGLLTQQESYEHLGTVDTFTMDLRKRFDELTADSRVYLTPEAAAVTVTVQLDAPPVVAWDWLNDPQKRQRWSGTEVRPILRPGGRLKEGAQNHCVHGKSVMVENIVDWRPFEYFTNEVQMPLGTIRTTYVLQATAHGTTFEDRTILVPRWRILRPFAKVLLKILYKIIDVGGQYRLLARAIRDETQRTRTEDASPAQPNPT